ncbi:MAG: hypothetical protein AAGI66_03340 [Cyanobacteria bacterium P01_H01_bin.74]
MITGGLPPYARYTALSRLTAGPKKPHQPQFRGEKDAATTKPHDYNIRPRSLGVTTAVIAEIYEGVGTELDDLQNSRKKKTRSAQSGFKRKGVEQKHTSGYENTRADGNRPRTVSYGSIGPPPKAQRTTATPQSQLLQASETEAATPENLIRNLEVILLNRLEAIQQAGNILWDPDPKNDRPLEEEDYNILKAKLLKGDKPTRNEAYLTLQKIEAEAEAFYKESLEEKKQSIETDLTELLNDWNEEVEVLQTIANNYKTELNLLKKAPSGVAENQQDVRQKNLSSLIRLFNQVQTGPNVVLQIIEALQEKRIKNSRVLINTPQETIPDGAPLKPDAKAQRNEATNPEHLLEAYNTLIKVLMNPVAYAKKLQLQEKSPPQLNHLARSITP